jgi:C4-dicarboxylate transporter DctM subunit
MSVTFILFGSLVVFLILSVPIGVALGFASLLAIFMLDSLEPTYLARNLATAVDSFPLMAIPFFILAGELMGKGGIAKRLIGTANAFFGKYTGGLAMVTVVTCMFFAAISGSGPATVAAIGGIMAPAMIEKGYQKGFSAALASCAGCIGVIIPPSIPMVVYCVSSGASISKLFIAGILPGIIIGTGLIGYSWYHAKRNKYQRESTLISLKEKMRILWDAKWSLLVPVIILGGIYGGIFTPTEAAAVAVAYGFFIGRFIYKDLDNRTVFETFRGAAQTTGIVLIILGTAVTFGRILTLEQVPVRVTTFITSVSDSKFVVLFLINFMLLIVGCFMETNAAIIILTPILLPVVTALGVDPIHFGIIMVVNLAIGFVTPPLGVNLFVACSITKLSLEQVAKAIIAPMLVMIIILMFLTYVPQISLFLPNLLWG